MYEYIHETYFSDYVPFSYYNPYIQKIVGEALIVTFKPFKFSPKKFLNDERCSEYSDSCYLTDFCSS